MAIGHLGHEAITPEALAHLRSQIGDESDIVPYFSEFTHDVIRHFATYNIAHENPLWCDPEYGKKSRYGSVIAAPMTEYVCSSTSMVMGGYGLHEEGIMSLHKWDDWEFYLPVFPGDRMRARTKLVDAVMRPSRWGGQVVDETVEMTYWNQRDELVSRWVKTSVRAQRASAKGEKLQEMERYRYSDEEIESIFADQEAEIVRGSEIRYFEDVNVGDDLGMVVKGPYTILDMICWWVGAGGPFVYPLGVKYKFLKRNPGLAIIDPDTNIRLTPEDSHWDIDYAKRNGITQLYDIGKQRTTSAVHLVTNWMGDDAWLKRLRLNFRKPNYVGDATRYGGTVVSKNAADHTVTCELTGTNQKGVCHADGYAIVQLVSKTAG